jgi:hypothetical protein
LPGLPATISVPPLRRHRGGLGSVSSVCDMAQYHRRTPLPGRISTAKLTRCTPTERDRECPGRGDHRRRKQYQPDRAPIGLCRLHATAVTGCTGSLMDPSSTASKRQSTVAQTTGHPSRRRTNCKRYPHGAHMFMSRKMVHHACRTTSRESPPVQTTPCAIALPTAVDWCCSGHHAVFWLLLLQHARDLQRRVPLAATWIRPADVETRWLCRSEDEQIH